MKNLELIEKSFKKNSTQQLVSKIEKLNENSQEFEVIVSILEKRGQDVSKWKKEELTVSDQILETIDESWVDDGSNPKETVSLEPIAKDLLIEEVDLFVDELIKSKRTGVYTEVMKSLGGNYESDLDELFMNASEEQLKDALSFKKAEENSAVTKRKKIKGSENKKSFKESKEIDGLKSDMTVYFSDKDNNSIRANIVKFFLSHKNNSEICELILDNKKLVHKRTNKLKKLDE